MQTISVINLKGGVAKTISSVNIAHILAVVHKKRVLLVDNDKQGNASKMFGLHNYDVPSIAEVMTERNPNMNDIIRSTSYAGLDVLPANMNLLRANLQVLLDTSRPQQTRLRSALKQVANQYAYCIIDNAPDINISVINALVASDDVLIPVKIDKFAFDGLAELKEQIDNTREELNPSINLKGCFVTCFQRNEVNKQGEEWIKTQTDFPVFETHIRKTDKVDERHSPPPDH
ncbi:ParA family protein [Paenibacillus thiaminolyticus]|uniref:ParA family protein n=1 Tax=Paenibacillus thiaminolyticus TaxID=49283 RepID=UPI001F1064DD|nr:AAA family ATPase [Paenibacillus thiaminolyticus]